MISVWNLLLGPVDSSQDTGHVLHMYQYYVSLEQNSFTALFLIANPCIKSII